MRAVERAMRPEADRRCAVTARRTWAWAAAIAGSLLLALAGCDQKSSVHGGNPQSPHSPPTATRPPEAPAPIQMTQIVPPAAAPWLMLAWVASGAQPMPGLDATAPPLDLHPQAATAPPADADVPATVDVGSVSIVADPQANGGATTDVDLVMALDVAAAQEIAKLSANVWFDTRGIYTAADRAQVLSWHVAPGGNVAETPVDPDGTPRAVFVFASYKSPGDHRQRIEGEGALAITLGPKDFVAEVSQ